MNDKDKDFEALLGFARSVQATAKFIDLSTTDKTIATNADDIVAQLERLGFNVYAKTAWQFFLDRDGEKVVVTRCPFNGKYQDVEVRDIFVDSNGTLYTSYGGGKKVDALNEIRNRKASGLVAKINSLIP